MEIVRLPPGQIAPADADCIRVNRLDDAQFKLEGTALVQCGDDAEADSVTIVGGELYPSYEAAETAGLAWIAEHCVSRVYISRDARLPD